MKLTVSIVHYKVPEELKQCLSDVQQALLGIESEIIVVNNSLEEQLQEEIQSKFPEVIWIQTSENLGFGRAHNLALRNAKGECICLLNPDIRLSKNIFHELLTWLPQLENPGIIGVRMEDATRNFLPESKRNIPLLGNSMEKFFGLKTGLFSPYYAEQIKEFETAEVPVISGAFMFMKKKVWEDIQGFDPRFFMFAEDIDVSIKSLQKGYINYYIGALTLTHLKGRSTQKDPQYLSHFYGAMYLFVEKYYTHPIKRKLLYALIHLQHLKAHYWDRKIRK